MSTAGQAPFEYPSLKNRRLALFRLSLAVIVALGLDFAVSMFHYEYARRHYSGKPFDSADALVVLFSGWSSEGMLNAETQRRLAWARSIYRLGLTGAIICSGGNSGSNNSGALHMREYLLAEGIPSANVLVESFSFDTITNMRRSGEIANERNWKRIAIVTSPLHVIRALRIARAERLDAIPAAYDTRVVYPPVGWSEAYVQTHHEWLAAIASLLPRSIYLRILEQWR